MWFDHGTKSTLINFNAQYNYMQQNGDQNSDFGHAPICFSVDNIVRWCDLELCQHAAVVTAWLGESDVNVRVTLASTSVLSRFPTVVSVPAGYSRLHGTTANDTVAAHPTQGVLWKLNVNMLSVY